MGEIRNFKGEVVRIESSSGDRWRHFFAENWVVVLGVLFLFLGFSATAQAVTLILQFFDIRTWTWRHLLLVSLIVGYIVGCWQIFRNWSGYSDSEERRAKNFIGFGAALVVIFSFMLILSIVGRLSLFFRPVTAMFSSGRLSWAGFWRLSLTVVSFVPLFHFGKEWIMGFGEE